MSHDPLCPAAQAANDYAWCFCSMLHAARAHERSRLLTRIDALHPVCQESSVTFVQDGCTCWNGIQTVRAIVGETA
jgi:hypothetical protein